MKSKLPVSTSKQVTFHPLSQLEKQPTAPAQRSLLHLIFDPSSNNSSRQIMICHTTSFGPMSSAGLTVAAPLLATICKTVACFSVASDSHLQQGFISMDGWRQGEGRYPRPLFTWSKHHARPPAGELSSCIKSSSSLVGTLQTSVR